MVAGGGAVEFPEHAGDVPGAGKDIGKRGHGKRHAFRVQMQDVDRRAAGGVQVLIGVEARGRGVVEIEVDAARRDPRRPQRGDGGARGLAQTRCLAKRADDLHRDRRPGRDGVARGIEPVAIRGAGQKAALRQIEAPRPQRGGIALHCQRRQVRGQRGGQPGERGRRREGLRDAVLRQQQQDRGIVERHQHRGQRDPAPVIRKRGVKTGQRRFGCPQPGEKDVQRPVFTGVAEQAGQPGDDLGGDKTILGLQGGRLPHRPPEGRRIAPLIIRAGRPQHGVPFEKHHHRARKRRIRVAAVQPGDLPRGERHPQSGPQRAAGGKIPVQEARRGGGIGKRKVILLPVAMADMVAIGSKQRRQRPARDHVAQREKGAMRAQFRRGARLRVGRGGGAQQRAVQHDRQRRRGLRRVARGRQRPDAPDTPPLRRHQADFGALGQRRPQHIVERKGKAVAAVADPGGAQVVARQAGRGARDQAARPV